MPRARLAVPLLALFVALFAIAFVRGPGGRFDVGSGGVPAIQGSGPPAVLGERAMTVHFYDVGQGLAALVDLPDGRHVLVDAGDRPRRPGCGETCADADKHLIARLHEDLGAAPIDLLWITHRHSDHLGGAEEVLSAFAVRAYADNGRDASDPMVRRTRRAAAAHGAVVLKVDPEHRDVAFPDAPAVTTPRLAKLTPIVPAAWPASCTHGRDANECSIGLRIDFGTSSVLFTGDAEHDEEAKLDPRGTVSLLQVAHHGSDTSTSPAFLWKTKPRYAVISAGRAGDGLNRAYCHPRALVVQRLSRVLGGPSSSTIDAFDGDRCPGGEDGLSAASGHAGDWKAVPASDALWLTARDGDVVLSTTGDGTFRRVGARY